MNDIQLRLREMELALLDKDISSAVDRKDDILYLFRELQCANEAARENLINLQREGLKYRNMLPKELKHKKDIPTVIEYQGRRYVLDDRSRK